MGEVVRFRGCDGVVGFGVVFALVGVMAGGVRADQPTLDELLELGPPEEQREALREEAAEERGQSPEELEEAMEAELQRMLESGRPTDVFEQAVRQMGEVSHRLASERDAGIETQRMQRQILDKLDQVIDAARQQQQEQADGSSGGGGGGEQSPQEMDRGGDDPAQSSRAEGETPGEAAGAEQAGGDQPHSGEASPGSAREAAAREQALRELRQEWGNLPPRLRDEISEGMNERFSPVYRSLTESYYQRLAEEEEPQ